MRVPEVIRKFFDLTDSQQERVIRIIDVMANLADQLAETEPALCPKCYCTDGFTNAGFEHITHTGGKRRLSKKVGGEAKNSGGDFGGDGLLTLGDTLGEKP